MRDAKAETPAAFKLRGDAPDSGFKANAMGECRWNM